MIKTLKGLLAALAILFMLPLTLSAQTPAAPSSGLWMVIDTSYNVGSYTSGNTKAKIYLRNTTSSTKVTGVQFRVFYDKAAFSSASVSLVGSPSSLNLQQIDSNASGFLTATVVYTGSSSTYSITDGQALEITFNHVSGTSFYSLSSIDSLKWSGTSSYPNVAASQTGLDTTLSLHSWGGAFKQKELKYHGTFKNVTGTSAKNLTLALEKKVKTSGTWSIHNTYITDTNGKFSLTEIIDTSYYDVRLAVKGDTMNVGNVISTADASLVNQWVLGTATPSAFDFYTADVNGSHNATITDAYGVFGRIAGRFSSWPNSVKDILFFTESEYGTITGSPSTNYTSSISGVTNFTFNILPGQPDSVTYYVVVPGDANGTGYHMARLTPIVVSPNPVPGMPLQTENVIDMRVDYGFPTPTIEVNMPSLKVNQGNLLEVPVTLKTNGRSISAMQLAMMYDENLLEFKELSNSEKSMFWLSSINANDGVVEWAGYDPSANRQYMLPDNYNIFTLKFIAKKPQSEWQTSPLYTSRKFSGDEKSLDMSVLPTNGIVMVFRMASPNGGTAEQVLTVFPNPTTGEFSVSFTVKKTGKVQLSILDNRGGKVHTVIDKEMPAGDYVYSCNLTNLVQGLYIASLQALDQKEATKLIKQ